MTTSEHYYCQTIKLKHEAEHLHCAFCLLSMSLAELKLNAKNFLHPTELAYFNTLKYEARQLSYLLGMFAAKAACIHYGIKASYNDLLIEPGLFRFPIIHYPGDEKLQISLSHARTRCVAIAFPEKVPMAIDLEMIDESKEKVIDSQLTEYEKQLFITNIADRSTQKVLMWTVKEALSKVLRTGLTTPFSVYAIKEITALPDHWVSTFYNFSQYEALSFFLEASICTLVYPRQVKPLIDIPALQSWFNQNEVGCLPSQKRDV